MYAGSKYESHYTVWTAWISIRVRVRVGVYFILQNLAPPGTTVHVPTAVTEAVHIRCGPRGWGLVTRPLHGTPCSDRLACGHTCIVCIDPCRLVIRIHT